MKRLIAIIALLVFTSATACFGDPASAPSQGDERGHPVLQLGSNKIEVDHGRPSLRGRNPEGLIQPGQVWRMGANDPTTLSTQGSLKFGDKLIPAASTFCRQNSSNQKLAPVDPVGGRVDCCEVPLAFRRSISPLSLTSPRKEGQGRRADPAGDAGARGRLSTCGNDGVRGGQRQVERVERLSRRDVCDIPSG